MHPCPAGILHGIRGLLAWPARSREQVETFQNQALRRLVKCAYREVPYYRRLFDESGITPDQIRTTADLPKIPVSPRAVFQSLPPSETCAKSVDPERLLVRRTSGSTGAPLAVRRHWAEERIGLLHRVRSRSAIVGEIWPMRGATMIFDPRRRSKSIHDWKPSGGLSLHWRLPTEEIAEALAEFRPTSLGGAPTILCRLADQLDEAARRAIRPRWIMTWTEALPAEKRRQLEETFRAPVREAYGSHETVFIGAECPQGGRFHICEESVIVEVVRDGRPVAPGETGEILVTALNSFCMPFLRYVQGDLVTLGGDGCPCGAPYRTLLRVDGRNLDLFEFPNGTSVHPLIINRLLRDSALKLRYFQITQRTPATVRIELVCFTPPSAAELEQVGSLIREKLAGAAELTLEVVDEIPLSARGKFVPYIPWKSWKAMREGGRPKAGS